MFCFVSTSLARRNTTYCQAGSVRSTTAAASAAAAAAAATATPPRGGGLSPNRNVTPQGRRKTSK